MNTLRNLVCYGNFTFIRRRKGWKRSFHGEYTVFWKRWPNMLRISPFRKKEFAVVFTVDGVTVWFFFVFGMNLQNEKKNKSKFQQSFLIELSHPFLALTLPNSPILPIFDVHNWQFLKIFFHLPFYLPSNAMCHHFFVLSWRWTIEWTFSLWVSTFHH